MKVLNFSGRPFPRLTTLPAQALILDNMHHSCSVIMIYIEKNSNVSSTLQPVFSKGGPQSWLNTHMSADTLWLQRIFTYIDSSTAPKICNQLCSFLLHHMLNSMNECGDPPLRGKRILITVSADEVTCHRWCSRSISLTTHDFLFTEDVFPLSVAIFPALMSSNEIIGRINLSSRSPDSLLRPDAAREEV